MSTHCKLIIGYTDHQGWWTPQKAYYRNSEGYIEAIKPLLQEFGDDIVGMNLEAEYRSHEWEELENISDFGNCEYQYYIDNSNRGLLRVIAVMTDVEFYRKYAVDSYKVIDEFTVEMGDD